MKATVHLFTLGIIAVLFSCNPGTGKKNVQNNLPDSLNAGVHEIELLTEQIATDTADAELYKQRSVLFLKMNNVNKALADINKAIQIDVNTPGLYLILSDIYLKMGDGLKSEKALLKAYQSDGKNISTLLKLGEVNFLLKDYKEAIKYLNEAIETDRNNHTAYLLKGFTYLEGGDTAKAVENFMTSVNNNQQNYEAVIQLALIFSRKNNPVAINYFKNAIGLQPKSIEAWYGLGMFYQNSFDAQNALSVYDTLIKITPGFKNSYYNKGYINMVMLDNFNGAIPDFSKAIEIDKGFTDAYYNRGFCYEKLGMVQEAVNDYKNALELQTNYQLAIDGLNRLAEN